MKDRIYADIICKKFCKYYKEGKEELHCGGYEILRNNLTPYELKMLAGLLRPDENIKDLIPSKNKALTKLICEKCDFFDDGCDFAEDGSGPPCGGYLIIDRFHF
jgi:hypothetical protein